MEISIAEAIEALRIEREEADLRTEERRAPIVQKLRESGQYSLNSTGLKMAIKIYELMSIIDAPTTRMEILYQELIINNYLALNSGEKLEATASLPPLGHSTKMNMTARRALIALVRAGLVTKTGTSVDARYSIAK